MEPSSIAPFGLTPGHQVEIVGVFARELDVALPDGTYLFDAAFVRADGAFEELVEHPQAPVHDGMAQVVLVLEVVIEQALAQFGGLGHLVHGRVVGSFGKEDPLGGVHDGVSALFFFAPSSFGNTHRIPHSIFD